jgi:hypothetical protein
MPMQKNAYTTQLKGKLDSSWPANTRAANLIKHKNKKKHITLLATERCRPARLELHESGNIGKALKRTSTAIGFFCFKFHSWIFEKTLIKFSIIQIQSGRTVPLTLPISLDSHLASSQSQILSAPAFYHSLLLSALTHTCMLQKWSNTRHNFTW